MSFQTEVGGLLIDLSLFFNKINPNPIVAIAAIELFMNKISNQYIFQIEAQDPFIIITDKEVKELYDQLWSFFKGLELFSRPELAIAALDITKYHFMKEIERLGQRRG